MKPATVFLSEMTNRELEQFLEHHHTVLIPTGSTEQHGPHSALGTDVLIPQELCRRVAPKIHAVVAPPISYGLPILTAASRESSLSASTRSWMLSRISASRSRGRGSAGSCS